MLASNVVLGTRFAPPQPASGWSEVRDASKDLEIKFTRFEVGVSGSEDCLYLSVYIPHR